MLYVRVISSDIPPVCQARVAKDAFPFSSKLRTFLDRAVPISRRRAGFPAASLYQRIARADSLYRVLWLYRHHFESK